MEWLLNIFSSPQDKARLVTVVLSSAVAVCLLLLSQHFRTRESRRDLRRQKIEELYEAASDYTQACRALLVSLREFYADKETGYFDPDRKLLDDIAHSVHRIKLLINLYFPAVSLEMPIGVAEMEIIWIEQRGKYIDEAEHHLKQQDAWDHVDEAEKHLDAICHAAMKKYG